MTEYGCGLGYRPRFGPMSLCNGCTTKDCTNPIYDVKVNIVPFGIEKERLFCDSDKSLEERTLGDYSVVISCEGFKKPEVAEAQPVGEGE